MRMQSIRPNVGYTGLLCFHLLWLQSHISGEVWMSSSSLRQCFSVISPSANSDGFSTRVSACTSYFPLFKRCTEMNTKGKFSFLQIFSGPRKRRLWNKSKRFKIVKRKSSRAFCNFGFGNWKYKRSGHGK